MKSDRAKSLLARIMKSRWMFAIYFILMPAAVCLFLALFPALIILFKSEGSFFDGLCRFFPSCYWLFGGFGLVGAVLAICTNIDENLLYGFGTGIYYGTLGLGAFMRNFLKWEMADEPLLTISIVIACLIAYIVWLEKFKPKED